MRLAGALSQMYNHALERRTRQWVIRLDDGFQLFDPDGAPLVLGKRRVEELLLLLAKSPGRRYGRDSIAEQIWPLDSVDSRRVNFRQALSHLKRLIGKDAIYADRICCGLTAHFQVRIEGDGGLTLPSSERQSVQGLVAAFSVVADWQSQTDAHQFLRTLRSNIELASAIAPHDVLRMTHVASLQMGPQDPARSQIAYWRGNALLLSQGIGSAAPFLKFATESSELQRDLVILEEAAAKLAVCEILAGRPRAGLRLLDRLEETVPRAEVHSSTQVSILRASALLHLGLAQEANAMMQRLSPTSSGTFAMTQSIRGLYEAILGNHSLAMELTGPARKYAIETGNGGIATMCRLTVGYVTAIHDPDRGIEILGELIADSGQGGRSHLCLYAMEALSFTHRRRNNLAEASHFREKAKVLRNSLGFGFTEWDRSRFRIPKAVALI